MRDPDLTPALASLVFVVRPPTATPTGRYLGCVHLQQLLREPPAALVGGILDTDLPRCRPRTRSAAVTRYFATYNLVCGPVVDEEDHLLGAVTVDDVLDHLLPEDWREQEEPEMCEGRGAHERLGPAAARHPPVVAVPVQLRRPRRSGGEASGSPDSSAPAAT